MFLSVEEIDRLPFELQKRELLGQANQVILEGALGPIKNIWLEGLAWEVKVGIVRHLVAVKNMDDLRKGLAALRLYDGALPPVFDGKECAWLLECLMTGINPGALHLDPACAVVSVVNPQQVLALRGIEARLFSAFADERLAASRELRMDDNVYSDGQGAIPARFIKLNREAIRSLISEIGKGEAMFSLERGGALVADHILNLTKKGIFNFKIPKVDPDLVAPRVPDEVRLNDPWWIYKQKFDDPKYQRTEHARRFRAAIDQFMLIAGQRKVKIVMTETLVGGASARKIMDQVSDVLKAYPNLKVKVLLHRHTLHGSNPVGGALVKYKPSAGFGPVTLFDGESSELSRSLSLSVNSIPKPYELTGALDKRPAYNMKNLRASVAIARGEYILGEDVGYQLAYEGEDAHSPVVIFSESQMHGVRALQLVPRGPMTARDILQRLVEGAYDHVLAQYGLDMELGTYTRP